MSKLKITSSILFLLLLMSNIFAQKTSLDQYRGEIGILGGTSFYIGEANPNTLFKNPGMALGALARYNFSPRYALKFSLKRGTVAGDTRDFKNMFPLDREASFERKLWDMGLHIEFNFSDYGLPDYHNHNKWFSPYIFTGLGLTSSRDELNDMSQIDFNFPLGLGIKIKINNFINLGCEWSWHLMYIDDLDVIDQDTNFLNNPYGFKETKGFKNKDAYSFATVFMSIDLFKRKYCK